MARLWLTAGERGQLELRVDAAKKEDLFYVREILETRDARGSSLEVSLQQRHSAAEQTLLSLAELHLDDARRCVLPLSLEPVQAAGPGVLRVLLDGKHVRGSPYAVQVRCGPLHPPATLLLAEDGSAGEARTSTGVAGRLTLILRDQWGNRCTAQEALASVAGEGAPPVRVALVPRPGSEAEQQLSGACVEAATRLEDPEEGVELEADADGGLHLYCVRHRAADYAVRLQLRGARVDVPMVVRVLPGSPHPPCCTFRGLPPTVHRLPLPPPVATKLLQASSLPHASASPPRAAAAAKASALAAAAASQQPAVWLATASETCAWQLEPRDFCGYRCAEDAPLRYGSAFAGVEAAGPPPGNGDGAAARRATHGPPYFGVPRQRPRGLAGSAAVVYPDRLAAAADGAAGGWSVSLQPLSVAQPLVHAAVAWRGEWRGERAKGGVGNGGGGGESAAAGAGGMVASCVPRSVGRYALHVRAPGGLHVSASPATMLVVPGPIDAAACSLSLALHEEATPTLPLPMPLVIPLEASRPLHLLVLARDAAGNRRACGGARLEAWLEEEGVPSRSGGGARAPPGTSSGGGGGSGSGSVGAPRLPDGRGLRAHQSSAVNVALCTLGDARRALLEAAGWGGRAGSAAAAEAWAADEGVAAALREASGLAGPGGEPLGDAWQGADAWEVWVECGKACAIGAPVRLHLSIGGQPVAGSPLPLDVRPGEAVAPATQLRGVPSSGRAVAGRPVELSLRCADAVGNVCRDTRTVRAAALLRPLGAGALSLGGAAGLALPGDGRMLAAAAAAAAAVGPQDEAAHGGGSGVRSFEAVAGHDGELRLSVSATRAQAYEVAVTVDGEPVPDGRFALLVEPAAPHAPHCALAPHGIGRTLPACAEAELRLTMRDIYGNLVAVAPHLPAPAPAPAAPGSSSCSASSGATTATPATRGARTTPPARPSSAYAASPASGAAGGCGATPLLMARCSCCDHVALEADPNDPFGCRVRFVAGAVARPTALGSHRLQLLLAGQHVQGSPFTFEVVPGAPHPPQCVAAGVALHAAARTECVSVAVTARDALGHRCRAGGAELAAAVAPCAHGHYGVVHAVEDNQDGSYVVTYSVAISGKYALQLTIGGQHIMGSPFRLVVAGAEASPTTRGGHGSPVCSPRTPSSPTASFSPRLHSTRVAASPPQVPVAVTSPRGTLAAARR